MTWEQLREGLYAAAALAFLIKFWMLQGRVSEFFSNHWPTFLKQFAEVHGKVHDNAERLAKLEGRK